MTYRMLTIQNIYLIENDKIYEKLDILSEKEIEDKHKIKLGKIALLQVGEIIYIAYNLSKPVDKVVISDIDDFFVYGVLKNKNVRLNKDNIEMSEEGLLFYFAQHYIPWMNKE